MQQVDEVSSALRTTYLWRALLYLRMLASLQDQRTDIYIQSKRYKRPGYVKGNVCSMSSIYGSSIVQTSIAIAPYGGLEIALLSTVDLNGLLIIMVQHNKYMLLPSSSHEYSQ